jgi:hypothetical protein
LKNEQQKSARPQRFEARLSGEGGQGVIMGGRILAEAAILQEGRFAVQSPTYGSRVRRAPLRSIFSCRWPRKLLTGTGAIWPVRRSSWSIKI